jgi:MerR family transcriptional regulator, light-induced transcriptional regulator
LADVVVLVMIQYVRLILWHRVMNPSFEPDAPMPAEHRYVSTAQVAQALGVSVTTVKRWVDEGILPAHRTPGGHRKLLMADVIRLVREGNLPQADLSLLVTRRASQQPDVGDLHKQMSEAIRKIDTDLIRSLVLAGYNAGIPVDVIADRVVSPAMQQLGHEWEMGKADVMKEHRISQAFVSVLYELRAIIRVNAESNRPIAVGGAPEHDHYILPTLLAKLTLLDAGWDAINLGPHTPFSAFESAIKQMKPELIWLSVAHLENPERFLSEYGRLYQFCLQEGISVAVGGRALTDSIRVKMPYTSFGDGMSQFSAFAKSLHRRPGRPKRGRPPGTGKNQLANRFGTQETDEEPEDNPIPEPTEINILPELPNQS